MSRYRTPWVPQDVLVRSQALLAGQDAVKTGVGFGESALVPGVEASVGGVKSAQHKDPCPLLGTYDLKMINVIGQILLPRHPT